MGASQPGAPGAFCSRWLSPGHDSRGTGPTHPELNAPPSIGSDFSGGSDGKESTSIAGDPGSIPVSRRFPGEGNGNPL